MSVLTPKRLFLAVGLLLSLSTAAFASHPSARSYARMAFDAEKNTVVLFGGESLFDIATQRSYDSDETWLWSGSRWAQIFPANSPQGRSAHSMVWDSIHTRIVLFGGRQARTTLDGEITLLNDTWILEDGNWRSVATPNAPEPRQLFALTYDSARDRVILFGGSRRNVANTDFEGTYDTWEFDGTTWTKIDIASPPQINFPQLAFDEKRNQTVLVGADSSLATKMYFYDPAARAWNEKTFVTDEKFPPCVNDASMVYRATTGTIILVGGVCSITTSPIDATWEWNGTTWTELSVNDQTRSTAVAIAYDATRDAVVTYGGFFIFDTLPRAVTLLFANNEYRFAVDEARPAPRSLGSFRTDPVTKTIWLYGGLNELSTFYISDIDPPTGFLRLWGYRNGSWFSFAAKDAPEGCTGPLSAYDIERSRLVVVCNGQDTFEFDGAAWKSFTPEDSPPARRFGGMVYDETLKKSVLFGGFDGTNYRNDTWTWDGTNWVEIKSNRPTSRGVFMMWYDPLQRKTIIYGGLGRRSLDERITRYTDMFALNGTNGWTKLNVTTTPGERMGAQVAVDQSTGRLVLFGGLRSELNTTTNVRRQFFDSDTWIWDGTASSWTKFEPAVSPHARQNGMMAWDPNANEIVLFGGYAGLYFSDTWVFRGGQWEPRTDAIGRRRPASPPRPPQPPSSTTIGVPGGN